MRKWLIRGLVYLLLAGLVTGGLAYALGTNPAAIRQLVQQQLGERFRHVSVGVARARLRMLGGILVRELRLARNDGLDRRDFLYVPSAVIYHDKEHMLDGKLLIRKVELSQPTLRLVRERDGRFNLAGIFGPMDLSERLPSIVIRQGTLVYEDRTVGDGLVLEVRNVQLTVVNDPLPALQVEGSGDIELLGPVTFRATVPRDTLAADMQVGLPAVPVGPDLVRGLAPLCPELVEHVRHLSGQAAVEAHLHVRPEAQRRLSYDITARLRQGRLAHPSLPFPLTGIEVDARCADGKVCSARMSAALEAGAPDSPRLTARLAELCFPDRPGQGVNLDELLRELDVAVSDLPVTPAVLARLPEPLRFLEREYSPSGAVSVRYRYRRAGPGPPVKEWIAEPQGMCCSFINFPYPLRDVRGTVRVDTSVAALHDMTLDLTCTAGGRPVALRGHIRGEKETSEVVLDINARDILLDDRIYRALPTAGRRVAAQFLPEDSRRLGLGARPMGQADVAVIIRRPRGRKTINRRYLITFKSCRASFDHFPLPLENVSGVLDLLPDHWECRQFRASHGSGEIFVEARSCRLDAGCAPNAQGPRGRRRDRIQVSIRGRDLPLDHEFERALAPGNGQERKGLQRAWKTLRLAGRLSFAAEVLDLPDQPQEIDVTVGVQGCFMRPTFFDYALEDVSGSVRYARGRVHLRNMKARHGTVQLGMESGLVQFTGDGGWSAWLEGISGRNVVADRELQAALPDSLRKGLAPLHLRDPLAVNTRLTLVCPPGGSAPLKVWWEGGAAFRDSSFQAGVEVTGATGQFFCRGHHDGRQLRGVWGDLVLDRAAVLGQPLARLHGRLEIWPDSPDVVRIRDVKASLFGGTVAAEARVEMRPVLRYDALVEALGIQLDQFGQHNLGAAARTAQLQGPARAALHLTGEGNSLLGLKGNGRVDVSQGKMGQLPVLLDLVKAFGLRVPDRTAFEQAHLDFGIDGPQLTVRQLDLYGNAISLRGQGTCGLDGSNLNLDFTATMGRVTQMLPAAIDTIPQAISEQLLKIKMRGKLGKGGEVRFDKELMPGMMEPLRRAFGGT